MKKLTFKALSVDWDYFVNCDAGFRYSQFPDGGNENLPQSVLDAVWQSRYAQSNVKGHRIEDLGILDKDFNAVTKLIRKLSDRGVPVYYFDSHKYAFNIITELFNRVIDGRDKDHILLSEIGFKVTNVDYHSDVYDFGHDEDEPDCGNWLRHLMGYYNLYDGNHYIDKDYVWIAREDSDTSSWDKSDTVCLNQGTVVKMSEDCSISDYLDDDYNVVFICRSGCWSPPHLDTHLCEFLQSLKSYNGEKVIDRYTPEFTTHVATIRSVMQGVFKTFKGK